MLVRKQVESVRLTERGKTEKERLVFIHVCIIRPSRAISPNGE